MGGARHVLHLGLTGGRALDPLHGGDGAHLTRTPLLVVEVLSPSTRRHDLGSKRLAYAGYGVAAYWVVDPEPPVTLVAFGLQGGAYVELARVTGEAPYQASVPFAVTVLPARPGET
ncbi:MAG: Uma2 family endonuclease [Acidimicrobiales bacterium]